MGFGGSAAASGRGAWAGSQVRWSLFLPFCSFDYFYEDAPEAGWLAGYLIFPFHVASFPSFVFAVLPVAGLAWMVEAARCILLFLGYYFSSSFAAGVTLECEKPTV